MANSCCKNTTYIRILPRNILYFSQNYLPLHPEHISSLIGLVAQLVRATDS